jgi:hypothetical protein
VGQAFESNGHPFWISYFKECGFWLCLLQAYDFCTGALQSFFQKPTRKDEARQKRTTSKSLVGAKDVPAAGD